MREREREGERKIGKEGERRRERRTGISVCVCARDGGKSEIVRTDQQINNGRLEVTYREEVQSLKYAQSSKENHNEPYKPSPNKTITKQNHHQTKPSPTKPSPTKPSPTSSEK